ncbi:hypothetical protein RWH43_17400 [Microbacterium sp. KSW2-21]|uniref:Uncharacterized protein n=1 Tax=Microbacterium algihabitans TaxID=3075992 RepID=A0ABU3S082_9MICO|nr:hypothetical protein [Microbacterium sp. KSW2-21]MDU0328539.1 hypothetical protein [Microbacterium sp. KSW2-21]
MPAEEIEDSPPRRSRARLQQWVAEFVDLGYLVASNIRIVDQEDSEGRDTGLVVVGLVHAEGSIYLEPAGYDEPIWHLTLSATEHDETMPHHVLASLAAELVVAGNLCTFLQWKSLEWDRQSGHHHRT